MSKRSDILEPSEWTNTKKYGLVYSEILGWIDLGHAQGDDIRRLREDIIKGENSAGAYYKVEYSQKMYAFEKKLAPENLSDGKLKKVYHLMRFIALFSQ